MTKEASRGNGKKYPNSSKSSKPRQNSENRRGRSKDSDKNKGKEISSRDRNARTRSNKDSTPSNNRRNSKFKSRDAEKSRNGDAKRPKRVNGNQAKPNNRVRTGETSNDGRTASPRRNHRSSIEKPTTSRRSLSSAGTNKPKTNRARSREDAPRKFDLPRRYRGDEPRRERDQRARGNAPVIDQDITGDELGEELTSELKSLPTGLTITVAQHLVMAQRYLEVNPALALIHAKHAKELAGRFPLVREIVGIARYLNENWQEALNDFRAVRRMTNADHLLPMMADCERGLGRPERAIEMLTGVKLAGVVAIEAAIVQSGARMDLGQLEAALVALKIPALTGFPNDLTAYARLCYAYAQVLEKLDRTSEASLWYQRADKADPAATMAAEHLTQPEDTVFMDDLDAS
jgi:hypothetical protein